MAERTKSIWTEWSFVAGVVVTAAVLAMFAWSLTFPVETGEQNFSSKWQYLQQATPNEIGDTLAGVAGSLAFVWVVVAVLLQSQELAAQREELAATRSELKLAREAQEQQVEVMKEQAEVFRYEQRQRAEARASALLEEASKNVIRCFYEADLETLSWYIGESSQDTRRERFLSHGYNQSKVDETSDRVLALLAELFGVAIQRLERVGPRNLHSKPERPAELLQLQRYLKLIVNCLGDLPEVNAERQREIRLQEAERSLCELIDGPFWDEAEAAQ
ncbi:hypothetical protein [Leisingera thetidis]|uniref:hypothetical protein n=1 Tax=Leisingera thetidis TaxID=2930199 RepID=UPI0021F73E29|nr:hypothetical protein [Leisingera thetidis]